MRPVSSAIAWDSWRLKMLSQAKKEALGVLLAKFIAFYLI